ncbi:BNR/Asp-box repeat protein [Asanoa ferruginea]|uniref:BNR/Asp-box repeat protein n=1 Tax=Asanoa ferruginea TaxID=53367 RepID=A0A3D9ZSI5_9ACTN|nr:sialidase family protein [Asanoa ferruginea]REG00118.1 BNR/Asp-box repeat protein [Asanoa ferruginea]GIF46189.1 hypothetical protein Afe04nite_07280 [Asanoa ferruginea]
MREPDFAGLAEAAGQAFRPDWADVVAKAARRRRFLRAFGAAAVVAVVAAGGGIATGGGFAGDGGPGPTPAPAPSGSAYVLRHAAENPKPGGSPIPAVSVTSYAVAGDLDHLYLPIRDCRSACVDKVAASADRGATWTTSEMPGGGINSARFLTAAAGETVVTTVSRPATATGYFTSTDAGRTWRAATVTPVEELPADAVSVGVDEDRLVAVDPATGDLASVALPIMQASVLGVAPEVGERWIFGYTGSEPTSRPDKPKWIGKSLAVSRDGGRTWSVRKLPKDAVFRSVAVADGKRAYALYSGRAADDLRLYRSDDGGMTWNGGHDITFNFLDFPDEGIFGLADGSAFISMNNGLTRTTDGRRTTASWAGVGPRAHVLAVPGGYVATSLNPEVGLWVSTDDGKTWNKLPLASVG